MCGLSEPEQGESHNSNIEHGIVNVEVFNVFGQRVYSNSYQLITINLTGQPDQVYFYRVLNENSSTIGRGKIIIEK